MLITPSFKKSLIVEQFQRNYLKIDAINGKKWVKFVAMQQDSATLIYDLNAMKGTMKSYLKKYNRHSKQNTSKPEKSRLVL